MQKYMDYVQPRVCRWIQKHEIMTNIDKVGSIKKTLDRLQQSDVTWDPYINYKDNGVVHAMAFYSGTLKYMDMVGALPSGEDSEIVWLRAIYTRSSVLPIGSTLRPICTQILCQVWVPQDNWERWRNHLLAPKFAVTRRNLSFWLLRTIYLGSLKCLTQ
ncbi:hypothetical protein Syun_029397 [Stephania yunnanensis]|uniref:Uncharacterized protein n=1 Tax=Stephania yunnanensis TaxID=152371 RepID=A0AAP0E8I7_9MAGN